MMLTRYLPSLLMAVACLAAGSAAAVTPTLAGLPNCTAASCVPPSLNPDRAIAGFGPSDYRPGQTFEPRFSGVLSEVHLGLWSPQQGGNLVLAEIRTVANGLPTDTVLGSAFVLGAPYAGNVLYTAGFAGQNVVLLDGTRYALTLSGSDAEVIYVLGQFQPCETTTGTQEFVHTYDAVTWSIFNDRSFAYEVCLDAVVSVTPITWGRIKKIYR